MVKGSPAMIVDGAWRPTIRAEADGKKASAERRVADLSEEKCILKADFDLILCRRKDGTGGESSEVSC